MRNVMILAAIQLRKFTFSVIMWFLEPYFKVLWEGVNLNFFIVFKRSAKKCFERSRIFRYGLQSYFQYRAEPPGRGRGGCTVYTVHAPSPKKML